MTEGVFISYSRDDEAYVTRLADHLRDLGIEVWVDQAIQRGERFADVIEGQIAACAALVAVLTPTAVASIWVRREISYADKMDKPILPLLLAPCRWPIIVHDLDYEDVTTRAMPSARFIESLRSRIGLPVRRPDPTRPRATLRGLVVRIEEVARENGNAGVLAALNGLAPRTDDRVVLQRCARGLSGLVRDLRMELTARRSEPAHEVWRARLRMFADDARSAIHDFLADVPEKLHQWVEGELNMTVPIRLAVISMTDHDIRTWQYFTVEPMTRQILERYIPAPRQTPTHATRLAQSLGDALRQEINRSLPLFPSSPWRRAVDYVEQFRYAIEGKDMPGRARVREAVLTAQATVAARAADRLADALVSELIDVVTSESVALPDPTADLAELDRIETALLELEPH